MAKSKNHTNHNQNRKSHRNGIKKPPKKKFMSRKGLDPKFFRNQRYCLRGNMKKKEEMKKQKLEQKEAQKS